MLATREDCAELDRVDPLAPLRELFELPRDLVYLDGNSLGALPKASAARLSQVVMQEWGRDLIGSWNSADWIGLPARVGDKIARLVGAGPGELVAADSTSVNLYKVLGAALAIARSDAPAATRIVSERSNFPTDLYIAQRAARERGFELVLAEPGEIEAGIDERVAVLMLTHVDY
ncbi:MAG TPA: kynureninase, partial [Burkholderiaceae bacterium]|nr:kynureninase [Burkholderiaceae bacterium]